MQKKVSNSGPYAVVPPAGVEVANWTMVLMNRIMVQTSDTANEKVHKFGFNIKGVRVLIALMMHGAMRVGDLGEAIALDTSTLSHLLRRLERMGYIERDRVKDDNRSVEVTLTAKGRTTAKICYGVNSQIESVLLHGFTQKEIDVLRQQLVRMCDNSYRALKPPKAD
jgi:DNA-binding MarR family transcriptional regulator